MAMVNISTGKDIMERQNRNNNYAEMEARAKANPASAANIRSQIEALPEYQIPEEIKQQLEMLQQSAEAIRGTQELAQEATGIAEMRAGAAEAPGEALAKRDIQQSTAATVQNILQAGGGGAGALSAIAKTGLAEQGALNTLAQQRLQYRSGAEADLMSALRSEAGLTAQTEAQAAGLESTGLTAMAGEKGKQYEYALNKELTGIQFNIDELSAARAKAEAEKSRKANIWASVIGAVGTVAGAAIGGPVGATLVGGLATAGAKAVLK